MTLPRSEKTIEKRRALRRHLAGLGSVVAVDAVDDQPGAAALEIVTAPRLERVPPAIVRAIGEHDHGLGIVQRQGDHWIVEVR